MKKKLPKSGFLVGHCDSGGGLNRYINSPNCTLFGERCDQPFTALYVWEKLFLSYGGAMERFIELGCDVGGMSTYFALWCHTIDAKFIGYDRRPKWQYKNTPVKRLIGLHDKVRVGNLYAKEREIIDLIKDQGLTMIFADCIDKPWEFMVFAPALKVGDIMAVHDWDRAIKDEWVEGTMSEIEPYELLYEDERLQINTLTRFFLKQ